MEKANCQIQLFDKILENLYCDEHIMFLESKWKSQVIELSSPINSPIRKTIKPGINYQTHYVDISAV